MAGILTLNLSDDPAAAQAVLQNVVKQVQAYLAENPPRRRAAAPESPAVADRGMARGNAGAASKQAVGSPQGIGFTAPA